ncbi:MAG: bifunctional farnesyl-diphosphate farnesyltransferase/squalene synthase [Vezdaea aestivalis]|nr:MAG: bifunctional farnesyl-diphosphate farnesyltransferase/squalene synthase [Vezdaea aestivalis]
MSSISAFAYYALHWAELRAIVQWKMWHLPVNERVESKEAITLKICFKYLEQTSRSFSAVIQELNPELLNPIALFYLILRGLDTIEDDTTISASEKEPLLRNFHESIEQDGWTFNGNGPDEKDRNLLVDFKVVVTEFKKVKPAYRAIIKDITEKMGNGMADYANDAEFKNGVTTVEEYTLYCHYVAGLVGEGLTQLFVESKLANPALLERPHLHESMGQFLQKVNIIRDVREDWDDKRRFWPKEIWSKHVSKFEDLFDPKHQDAALNCSTEMILDALQHADECIFYLAGLKDQSVFNFCAIPQAMAIATLEVIFRNPAIFHRNVKITKGQACRLMIDSTQNLRPVCDTFIKYSRSILKKNTNKDPNFLKISVACGKIEKFVQTIFPDQDPTLLTAQAAVSRSPEPLDPEKEAEAAEARKDTFIMLAIVMATLFAMSCFMVSTSFPSPFLARPHLTLKIQIGIAYFLGARFDLAYADLKQGRLPKTGGRDEL